MLLLWDKDTYFGKNGSLATLLSQLYYERKDLWNLETEQSCCFQLPVTIRTHPEWARG